jgi:hypothetical protein
VNYHRVWRDERTRWSLFAAAVFVLTASVFVVPFTGLGSSVSGGRFFSAASALSAGIVGGASWSMVERHADDHFVGGGVVAGAVTGVVSHPLAWALVPILTPGIPVGSALVLPLASLGSLLLVGWITLPLGVVGGVIVGVVRTEAPEMFAE